MANWDNLSTKQTQQDMDDLFDEGVAAGYDAPLNPLPDVAYKFIRDMTPRERGFVLGWLVKMDEHLRGQG